jgi:hypothetical protein
VVDATSGQVIAMPLSGGAAKAIYGENKDLKRGKPLATAYSGNPELGSSGALLIADTNRNLWSHAPGTEPRPVPFAAPPNLHVTDIAVFGRSLYVLDASDSVIYRFDASEAGFSTAPTKALESPDLAAARRIRVGGRNVPEIVTSDATGALHFFSGQVAITLSQSGIDDRLVAPEPPQLMGANGDIGILDAAHNRIVVFRRDGTFDRQYRHKDFQGITAFAMGDGKAYVFSGGRLRAVTW